MANPTCYVDITGTGSSLVPTINGVNCTSGHLTMIALHDTAGAQSWSITCIGTDELNVQTAITSSLTVNSITQKATFTFPSTAGAALLFQSTINNGLDINGRMDPSLTTTFGLFLPVNTLRLGAQNETTQGDSVYGWTSKFNDAVRAIGSGSLISADGYGLAYFSSNNTLGVVAADNSIQVNAHSIQLNTNYKTWLDAATSSPTANTLVFRSSTGAGIFGDSGGTATYGSGIYASAGATFTINQVGATSDVACHDTTIFSQAPYSTASVNQNSGNIVLNTPNPVAGGVAGNVNFSLGTGGNVFSYSYVTSPMAVGILTVNTNYEVLVGGGYFLSATGTIGITAPSGVKTTGQNYSHVATTAFATSITLNANLNGNYFTIGTLTNNTTFTPANWQDGGTYYVKVTQAPSPDSGLYTTTWVGSFNFGTFSSTAIVGSSKTTIWQFVGLNSQFWCVSQNSF